MKSMGSSVTLAIAVGLCAAAALFAQAPAAAPHPSFAGTWEPNGPNEPKRSNDLFAVGLTPIPGSGRLTIEQRPDRLTVTITMPDDKLDPLMAVTIGRFYTTIVYHLSDRARSGGAGASGPQPLSGPTWFDDRLVIPDERPWARSATATYSLDGDQLRLERRIVVKAAPLPSDTIANTVTQWFTKVK